jgi:lipoate-protein ligase A
LQGIGSLNFSLALDFQTYPQLKNLHDSYCWILKQLSMALEPLGITTKHEGICDLALNGQKISGNAQRRRRNALLHHGTLLYHIDPAAMMRYLPEPADRPDYRGDRGHDAFVTAIALPKDELTQAMSAAFPAAKIPLAPTPWELHETQSLAREKYENPEWNFRR